MRNPNVKHVTCALMVVTPEGVLLVHPTGHRRDHSWSFPKGLKDEGERTYHAALRECFEETGLDLRGNSVTDLGTYSYTKEKDYNLFMIKVPDTYIPDPVDLSKLHCASLFEDKGRMLPEVDDFCIKPLREALELLNPKQSAILAYVIKKFNL